MEHRTDDSPEARSAQIPFSDTTSGMLAGLWHVPIAGFRWTDEYRPWAVNGPFDPGDEPRDPGPWLIPVGDHARRYAPLRRRGLLEAMDRLALKPTPERIQSFANRWGHLGIPESLAPAQRRADGASVATAGTMEWGESLSSWRTELYSFGDLRQLWRAVSVLGQRDGWGPSRVREAERVIADRVTWSSSGGCLYHSRYEAAGGWREWNEHIFHPSDRDATAVADHLAGQNTNEAARFYLHRRINKEMRGRVSPAVLPFLGGVIRFFPDSLLAAVWVRFAQEVAGAPGRERECESCRMPFLQRRRDQRFCSKNCQEASAYRRRTAAARPGPETEVELQAGARQD